MNFSRLETYDNSISANLVKNKLELAGIPCILTNEKFTNLMPHFYGILGSGVQILVPQDRIEEAKKVAGIKNTTLTCPSCNSINVSNKNVNTLNKIRLFLIMIFFSMPIGNLLNDFFCEDCNHEFKN